VVEDGEAGREAVCLVDWLVVQLSVWMVRAWTESVLAVEQWSYASINANISFEKKAVLSLF